MLGQNIETKSASLSCCRRWWIALRMGDHSLEENGPQRQADDDQSADEDPDVSGTAHCVDLPKIWNVFSKTAALRPGF